MFEPGLLDSESIRIICSLQRANAADYEGIEELRHEYELEQSMPVITDDLKNHYAWLAFEEAAWQLAIELEPEV